jgi:hypothetical protein
MGSVFDSASGQDTLFIAGGTNSRTLGTVDLSSLLVTVVTTTLTAPHADVAGTGDGQLWLFTPAFSGNVAFLERVDPDDGNTLEHYDLPQLGNSTTSYAIKFFGGAFYMFLGAAVWKLPRSALLHGQTAPTSPPTMVLYRAGLEVVGAGVSTCAPVTGN